MKTISIFAVAFLVFGVIFLSSTQRGYSQPEDLCCQYFNTETESFSCSQQGFGCPLPIPPNPIEFIDGFDDSSCNNETGLCSGFSPVKNIPTLSEWSLIALALALGFIGFFMLRRSRKATA